MPLPVITSPQRNTQIGFAWFALILGPLQSQTLAILGLRDPAALKCIVSAPSHISDDLADAREQVRWFPAMVSNHVMDLVERYGFDSEIPQALTDYVKARKFYDYNEHSRVGARHGEFVTDEICDRFCVLGTAEQATVKLRELESVGVDQFNIYLMTHGQEEVLQAYGDHIIPGFTAAART